MSSMTVPVVATQESDQITLFGMPIFKTDLASTLHKKLPADNAISKAVAVALLKKIMHQSERLSFLTKPIVLIPTAMALFVGAMALGYIATTISLVAAATLSVIGGLMLVGAFHPEITHGFQKRGKDAELALNKFQDVTFQETKIVFTFPSQF